MIRFNNVSKQYNDAFAVKNINLSIKEGEFFVLIGPSGCGKTTTLKMINRLINPTGGEIHIKNKNIESYNLSELRWNIGYVLQQIALFPHLTIAENISLVPEMKKWKKSKIEERTDELLEMVGLPPNLYKQKKPKELSGGQQQRIGVIRALAANPEIIIMDEPFSALDPISREKLQDDLLTLQKKIKKTIVFVTHDMNEALKLGDRICILKEGEIIQIGTPNELLTKPKNSFVKEFINRNNDRLILNGTKIPYVPVSENDKKECSITISADSSLETALEILSEQEEAGVVKDGQMVGFITRKTIIDFMRSSIRGGESNE